MLTMFFSGTGRIWLDELDCNGTELSLDECSHGGWGVVDCGHKEDVGIICTNITLSKGKLGENFKSQIPECEYRALSHDLGRGDRSK